MLLPSWHDRTCSSAMRGKLSSRCLSWRCWSKPQLFGSWYYGASREQTNYLSRLASRHSFAREEEAHLRTKLATVRDSIVDLFLPPAALGWATRDVSPPVSFGRFRLPQCIRASNSGVRTIVAALCLLLRFGNLFLLRRTILLTCHRFGIQRKVPRRELAGPQEQ